MKRIIARPLAALITAVLIICAGLTACGKPEPPATQAEVSTETVTSAAASAESAAASTAAAATTPAVTEPAATEQDAASPTKAETVTRETQESIPETGGGGKVSVREDETYTGKEEVAAYINEFGKLPSNFITKSEAKKLGWVSSKGNLWDVAYGKSIGGDRFGNYEGNLPDKKGRQYYECDIGYEGGFRGAERIIFSDDGLIYYTDDHYQTFELLYGEE